MRRARIARSGGSILAPCINSGTAGVRGRVTGARARERVARWETTVSVADSLAGSIRCERMTNHGQMLGQVGYMSATAVGSMRGSLEKVLLVELSKVHLESMIVLRVKSHPGSRRFAGC